VLRVVERIGENRLSNPLDQEMRRLLVAGASRRAASTRFWRCAHVELDGVLSAVFDEQMRFEVFQEWWHRRETRADPPGISHP
jgi:hypothetical protein